MRRDPDPIEPTVEEVEPPADDAGAEAPASLEQVEPPAEVEAPVEAPVEEPKVGPFGDPLHKKRRAPGTVTDRARRAAGVVEPATAPPSEVAEVVAPS